MKYWNNLANIYNANLNSEKNTISADTTPVQKSVNVLKWSDSDGDIQLKYLHSEHSHSFNNSPYCELQIMLYIKLNSEFNLTQVDFLEKVYAIIWKRKNRMIFGDYLYHGKNISIANRIIDQLKTDQLSVESIELKPNNNKSVLKLTCREDFIRNQNAESYIEFLLKVVKQLNNT